MKTIFSLRFLCVLSFLLLFCPFYDSCNSKAVSVPTLTDTTKSLEKETEKKSFFEKAVTFIDNRESSNAVEFAQMSIQVFRIPLSEFKNGLSKGITKNDVKGLFFWLKNFCFLFICIIVFLQLVFCFTSKKNLVFRFSKWILILTIITIICIFFEGFFKEMSQFKWGYYCFLITSMLVFYVSRNLFKTQIP